MRFWYKGTRWQYIQSYRIITRGKKKGQVECTFQKYGKPVTATVYSEQTRGIPEFKAQDEARKAKMAKKVKVRR